MMTDVKDGARDVVCLRDQVSRCQYWGWRRIVQSVGLIEHVTKVRDDAWEL